ncbi:MAG: hypothetical protein IJH83_01405 [Coriobacteriales bacterium]|nr:hypothetical protein [Coriobacteriales bacterium]
MNLRKGVVGAAISVAMIAGLGAALAYADESYKATTLGNPDYTNYVDLRNDIYVDGMNYVGSIGSQNADTVDAAAALTNQFGTQGEDAYALTVINKLDQPITKLEIKPLGQTSFTDLGLTSSIAAGDKACWWYTQEYDEVEVTNRAGKTYVMPINYTFQATLADGTVAVFHDVNMKGVLSLGFRYSADYEVFYVERTTVTNHTPDPTLYYEYNLARGFSDESDEVYTAEEFNYHVNSSVRLANRMFTASRSDGTIWEVAVPNWEDVDYSPDFGVYVPLYGEPSQDYTDGTYEHVYWNPQLIIWRITNGDAGVWGEAGEVAGAGEYGGNIETIVDYHPGMAEGDWTYTAGEAVE